MGQEKTARDTFTTPGSNVRSGGGTATAPRPTKTGSSPKGVKIPHDQIAQRAHEIWIKKGRLPGQDEQNWLEAEAQLRAERTRK